MTLSPDAGALQRMGDSGPRGIAQAPVSFPLGEVRPLASCKESLPSLPGLKGRSYYAVDSDGQWFYISHGNTWQTCPPLLSSPAHVQWTLQSIRAQLSAPGHGRISTIRALVNAALGR